MIVPRAIIDLTQPLGPRTVMWPGTRPPVFLDRESYASHGSFSRAVTLDEHSGTHVDAPAHFVEAGATVDQLPAERLVCPLIVVDVRSKASVDSNYAVSVEDIDVNEELYGRIPPGAVVAVCTGWGERSGEESSYLGLGPGGTLSFPGIAPETATWLVEKRRISGLGIDTAGVDIGRNPQFPVHRGATLASGVWHLEGLVQSAQGATARRSDFCGSAALRRRLRGPCESHGGHIRRQQPHLRMHRRCPP